MKRVLLFGLLAAAFVISSCDQQSNVSSPVTPSTNDVAATLKLADQLTLTTDQFAQVEELFYLDVDMNFLLSPSQTQKFDLLVSGLSSSMQDGRFGFDPHRVIDMDAVMYYRLILAANPDLSDTIRQQIRDLIAASNQTRVDIIRANAGTPDIVKQLLADEHQKLMDAINALLTDDQKNNVQTLKDQIEARRKALQAHWDSLRINYQVAFMTRLLTLTSDQADAIRGILFDQLTQLEALRLQYQGDPEGFRAALKDLMTNTETQIEALLTTDQLQLWNAFRLGLGGRRGHGGPIGPIGPHH
jgi:hypothetical protein